MSVLNILGAALKNFSPDQSIYAGGAASVATVAIGAVLVAMNVTVPILGVPLTMAMVTSAAIPIGHLVSSFIPATYNQQVTALARKVGAEVEDVKALVPSVEYTYPGDPILPNITSNINKG